MFFVKIDVLSTDIKFPYSTLIKHWEFYKKEMRVYIMKLKCVQQHLDNKNTFLKHCELALVTLNFKSELIYLKWEGEEGAWCSLKL